MPTLNEEAFRIVQIKEARLISIAALPRFSIVFMGDTHVGMASCTERHLARTIDQYELLLKSIKDVDSKEGRRTLAIVHGGDGTHVGEDNLERFINATVATLYTPEKLDVNKIPLFMNAGNHEYKVFDPKTGMIVEGVPAGYEKLVQANVLLSSQPPGQHPDVQVVPLNALSLRIVLLNTGYGNNGNFSKIDKNKFEREVTELDRWMTNLEKTSSHIRFIIDMHIPPNIGRFGTKVPNPLGPPVPGGPHVLNDTYNALFKKYILDRHKDSITAVVSHHRHCIPINNDEFPLQIAVTEYPKINFFITPCGGNCDTACGGKCNPKPCSTFKYRFPYHAVKVNFGYLNGDLRIETFQIITP